MVPYTLSKRYQDSKNRTAKTKAAALKKAKKADSREEGGSDSDDEPVSFFSHLDELRPSSNSDTLTTYSPNVSNSDVARSDSHSNIITTVLSNPSTTAFEAAPTVPQLANSAPIAPKPFRITDPNYDPITGIYSYGNSTNAPPPQTLHQGYDEPSEVEQVGSGSSEAGGWEQYYSQAEQELPPGDEYFEAHQQDYPDQHGPVKPMPGPGPGLSIDDDVVCERERGRGRE